MASVHVLNDHASTLDLAAAAMDRRVLAVKTAIAYTATFGRVGQVLGDGGLDLVGGAVDLQPPPCGAVGIVGLYHRPWLDRPQPRERVGRRRERRARTQEAWQRPIPYRTLEAIWSDRSHGIREWPLWLMLYETAARANEVLTLDIEDLDLAERSAVTVAKGGDVDRIYWQPAPPGSCPTCIGGGQTSPMFVPSRRPTRPMPTADVDPTTGRARPSYRRAEVLWLTASGGLTLHQLRHSRLTHLAEANVDTALLRAKSCHRSIRSLERCIAPSQDAVKQLTDHHDPARRRGTR